jgi:hypothetical protein
MQMKEITMAWAAPSLVCILSTYTSISLSLARWLCVSWRRKCVYSLGSSAQDGKKVNTFSYLRFFILFLVCLTASDCQACEEVDTYENIMDNYCRADFGEFKLISGWMKN